MIARPCDAPTLPSSCLVRYELIAAVVSTLITMLTSATSTTIAAATRTLNERAANPHLTLMIPRMCTHPWDSLHFPCGLPVKSEQEKSLPRQQYIV